MQEQIEKLKRELGVVEDAYRHIKFESEQHEINYLKRKIYNRGQRNLHNIAMGRD